MSGMLSNAVAKMTCGLRQVRVYIVLLLDANTGTGLKDEVWFLLVEWLQSARGYTNSDHSFSERAATVNKLPPWL